jgi:hypothetical protein
MTTVEPVRPKGDLVETEPDGGATVTVPLESIMIGGFNPLELVKIGGFKPLGLLIGLGLEVGNKGGFSPARDGINKLREFVGPVRPN